MSHRRKIRGMKNEHQPKEFLCPHGVNVKRQSSYERWSQSPFSQNTTQGKRLP